MINIARRERSSWGVLTPTGYSDAPEANRRYRARMVMTHALITTAQAPIARGPLQAIRLRVRRLALECAG